MTINKGLTFESIDPKIAALIQSGIHNPDVKKLTPGTKLYRFTNSNDGVLDKVGPWWFGQKALHLMVRDAIAAPDFGLGWAGRRNLAIRRKWAPDDPNSLVDRIMEAIVSEEIYIFYGRGTVQRHDYMPNGMHFTWSPPKNIEQWYLYGVSNRNGTLTEDGARAIRIYRTAEIKSYALPEDFRRRT